MTERDAMGHQKTNPHIGSDLEDFLVDEAHFEQSTARALKRVLVWRFEQATRETGISQPGLARRMRTSRAVVQELLDATDPAVTLSTISRAAVVLGRTVHRRLGSSHL